MRRSFGTDGWVQRLTPAPCDVVLLTDPRLVLEPYFYGRALWEGRSNLYQRGGEAPFKVFHGQFVLGMVARLRCELDIAQLLQFMSHSRFISSDTANSS